MKLLLAAGANKKDLSQIRDRIEEQFILDYNNMHIYDEDQIKENAKKQQEVSRFIEKLLQGQETSSTIYNHDLSICIQDIISKNKSDELSNIANLVKFITPQEEGKRILLDECQKVNDSNQGKQFSPAKVEQSNPKETLINSANLK